MTITDKKDVLEGKVSNLTDRQINIYNRLQATGRRNVLENVLETSATLAAYLGVSERTIRRDLAVLQSNKLIRHNGLDKGGRWIIEV